MSLLLLSEVAAPATPATGKALLYSDTGNILCYKDDSGNVQGASDNAATAAQGPGFAADTYLTNSDLLVPSFGLQAKSRFRWIISVSKTAAGVATPIYQVRLGSARTTADTSRLTLTGSAQTAAADVALIILVATMRSVGASGVLQATVGMLHNLAATGFASNAAGLVEGTSAGFDTTTSAGLFLGLSLNGGASAAWTVTQVRAEAWW